VSDVTEGTSEQVVLKDLTEEDRILSQRIEIAAHEITAANMLMSGKSVPAIAKHLELPADFVRKMLVRPGVRQYLTRLKEKVEEGTILKKATIQQAINRELMEGLKTLRKIHRSDESADRDRIRAVEVLWKYQDVILPHTKQNAKAKGTGSQHLHVHLGARQVENMKAAMIAIGKEDIAQRLEEAREQEVLN